MSRLPFELMLALRYLRPKRAFVSIITVISVLGVMLGVAVLIIVISVMSGFDKQLRDTILGFNAHLTVYQVEHTMTNYPAVMRTIAADPNVKGIAPFVMGQVLLETQPPSGEPLVAAPWLKGIDPQLETNVSVIPASVVEGKFDVSGRGLLIGRTIADKLGLRVGDRLAIYSPRELRKMEESHKQGGQEAILPDDYEVRGIFDVGYFEYNANVIVTSLENAQDLYDLGDNVHSLALMLRDPFAARTVQAQLRKTLGANFTVATWLEQSSLLAAVMVEKNVMLYILFFIVIVAAFGITCTLITFVVMKTREIGLMKALGATGQQVMTIFLMQSLIISILGVLVGLVLGLLAVSYRNEFLELMRRTTGAELFPASIYGFTELPALIVPGDILIICGGSLLICLLAAAFPARYASRLNPVEALRYE
jgi:lipoprotein-releasing system permease protein